MDVVIGAAFGDEGKGLITDYLASRYGPDAMVVRFNGGAQAGHTVVTPQGQRHVFRHVGSGTFAGAATFLSRFFVSNPVLFLEEMQQLQAVNLQPKIYIDPQSLITTPYDMMMNQIAEEARGDQRHGSCGVGFAETIERNLHPAFRLTVADIENRPKIIALLQSIRDHWLPERLQRLGISVPPHWQPYLASDDMLELYIHQLSLFLESINLTQMDLTHSPHPVIFEGAQGLMLDQDRGWFPHVTRSHTGLKNVVDLIKHGKPESLNVIYVARSYLTRHGAGPLPHELSGLPYSQAIDKTNVTNTYQGALRYAWFNLTLLKSFIQSDLSAIPSAIPIHPQLAVTCLDQVDEPITFVEDEKMYRASQAAFLEKISREMGISDLLYSDGPTRENVKQWRSH